MTNIIDLSAHRQEPGKFCLSITVNSDGEVRIDKDDTQLRTRLDVIWALAAIALGVHDLVEYKNTLPELS